MCTYFGNYNLYGKKSLFTVSHKYYPHNIVINTILLNKKKIYKLITFFYVFDDD